MSHREVAKPLRIEIQLAEIKLFERALTLRTRICYSMIASSVCTLLAGVAMLVVGLTGEQVVWLDSASFKVTAGGFGAVTMIASVGWGYMAYLTRPTLKYQDGPRGGSAGRRVQVSREMSGE